MSDFDDEPPASAAWHHELAREGCEVMFATRTAGGFRFDGHTCAVEGGLPWHVAYAIEVDRGWATRSARVAADSGGVRREIVLARAAPGRWLLDRVPAPELDGLVDVDLAASVFTNALPVRRLGLAVGEAADAPAVWIGTPDLGVARLEQRYARLPDQGDLRCFAYESPAQTFAARLTFDRAGLVTCYPGLARRVDLDGR